MKFTPMEICAESIDSEPDVHRVLFGRPIGSKVNRKIRTDQ